LAEVTTLLGPFILVVGHLLPALAACGVGLGPSLCRAMRKTRNPDMTSYCQFWMSPARPVFGASGTEVAFAIRVVSLDHFGLECMTSSIRAAVYGLLSNLDAKVTQGRVLNPPDKPEGNTGTP
jgi:hypothetical protein